MSLSDPKLPLLVWDADDVLNSLMELWLKEYAPERVRGIPYARLSENPPCRVLDLSMEEYLSTLDRCRREKLFSLPPRPEVLAWFREYGSRFRHIVLSAVPLAFMENSSQWVLHWFGDWIQCTMFVPSFRPDRTARSVLFHDKGEALNFWGDDAVLIDDSPRNCCLVRERGGKFLLFPAPWNENRTVSIRDFLHKLGDLKTRGAE